MAQKYRNQRRSIMVRAWQIFRKYAGLYNFAECLRLAWAAVRGATYHFCVSTSNGRVFGFAQTRDAIRAACVAMTNELAAQRRQTGLRIYGGNEGRI